ncbi:unnamed protein product [Penicillium roqueforti FM164]|uniref:Basic-leucine zipper domain n=1 Tax=Penicillium roqueforti (strain FM164) TaxID=1365484 RepID=W6QPK7_PENRF|nr:unnamed protein product [Penicillium roqueforti FM164]
MSSQDEPPARRRESRSGSRKVSTLSAEQLERKRANDREAQRSIRQRTKEHIEHLESQIEEMRLRTERFDEVVQHNAFLENEVIRLKHQVAALTGRPEFASSNEPMASFRSEWSLGEPPNSAISGIPAGALPPPHFTATSHTQPSGLLVPRRASPRHDWQQPYPPTRSPSLGAASNPEFPNRMEPYPIDSRIHQGQPICPPQQQSESSFSEFTYSDRSLSMSSASPVPQPTSAQAYQPSTSAYPQPMPQSQQTDPTYEFPWVPPS